MFPANYLFTNHLYLINMYKQDLTLNNLQGLICHKPNQPITFLKGGVIPQ